MRSGSSINANTMQSGCRNKHFWLITLATIVYLQWVNQSYFEHAQVSCDLVGKPSPSLIWLNLRQD
jgi:hypothetical protein